MNIIGKVCDGCGKIIEHGNHVRTTEIANGSCRRGGTNSNSFDLCDDCFKNVAVEIARAVKPKQTEE